MGKATMTAAAAYEEARDSRRDHEAIDAMSEALRLTALERRISALEMLLNGDGRDGAVGLPGSKGGLEHDLKALPRWFTAVQAGRKTFEVRVMDRPFDVGDVLCIREYDAHEPAWRATDGYSGRVVRRRITFILEHNDAPMMIAPGYGVLALGSAEVAR